MRKKLYYASKKSSEDWKREVDIFCFKTFVKVGKPQICLMVDLCQNPIMLIEYSLN